MIRFGLLPMEKKVRAFNSNLGLCVDDDALRTLREDSTEEDPEIKGVKELGLHTEANPVKEKRPSRFGTTGELKKEIIPIKERVSLSSLTSCRILRYP